MTLFRSQQASLYAGVVVFLFAFARTFSLLYVLALVADSSPPLVVCFFADL